MLQRATAQDALRLARRGFQAAERIDMSALADELGVNRVTLYRWVGSRERLLVEVIWSLAAAHARAPRTRATRRPAPSASCSVVTRFLDDVI